MNFSNTYVTLGERFYQKSQPTPVSSPALLLWNKPLATQLDIPLALQENPDELAQYFSGNRQFVGSEPIATAYAGHQFGQFNPHMGDGRAHLLGEILDVEGKRWDLQLKGSGPSAYSRSGDGRCALGPALREFIMSEAMKALGVPTTECLAVVGTGESVYRQTPSPGAVVTRVASSHLRVGHFQYFAARGDTASLDALCQYAIERHFAEVFQTFPEKHQTGGNRYVALLDVVIERQIKLITEWMRVGFIHGVMNTDNTAISGDTLDFGPCAMMGVYDPLTVYSSIDRQGRYAFGNQAHIAHWNMARFAECLLSLVEESEQNIAEQLRSLIEGFASRFHQSYWQMMAGKFGLLSTQEGDEQFISSLLTQLAERKLDYTITFDLLSQSLLDDSAQARLSQELASYFELWRERVLTEKASPEEIQASMRRYNPVLIPRNHHVEAVLKACEENGDASAAQEFLEVLRQPYQENKHTRAFQSPAEDKDQHYQTFCGT